jgi:hypothetical protein
MNHVVMITANIFFRHWRGTLIIAISRGFHPRLLYAVATRHLNFLPTN